MRRVVVNEFLTLDGVMQGPGSPDEDREGSFDQGGWMVPFSDQEQLQAVGGGLATVGGYLLGRKTYEIFAKHWPHEPDDNPFAATLNNKPKYVVSTTLHEPLEWRNSTLISGDLASEVARLKDEPGGDISVLGSGELVRGLGQHNLVDEYWLMICPIVLGQASDYLARVPRQPGSIWST